jgi:hypothetical protein
MVDGIDEGIATGNPLVPLERFQGSWPVALQRLWFV